LNQILYECEAALVADEKCKLQILFSDFGRVCERRKVYGNVANSKVMRVWKRKGER
jgi:hypothetical protein